MKCSVSLRRIAYCWQILIIWFTDNMNQSMYEQGLNQKDASVRFHEEAFIQQSADFDEEQNRLHLRINGQIKELGHTQQ
jgi:hypothetical protein